MRRRNRRASKKRCDKRRSQREHFITRVAQRHGLTLTETDLDQIASKIKRGESTFVSKTSNTRTVHDVPHLGAVLRVVYDKSRGTPVTVLLPPESLNTGS